MLKFDKAFIKVDGEIIELPIGNCSSVSGSAQYWQAVYTADSDMPSGSTIEIPEGIYDPATDLLTVNQEGFILIQNYQYTEANNVITLNLDIPNGTNISVTVLKFGEPYIQPPVEPSNPDLFSDAVINGVANSRQCVSIANRVNDDSYNQSSISLAKYLRGFNYINHVADQDEVDTVQIAKTKANLFLISLTTPYAGKVTLKYKGSASDAYWDAANYNNCQARYLNKDGTNSRFITVSIAPVHTAWITPSEYYTDSFELYTLAFDPSMFNTANLDEILNNMDYVANAKGMFFDTSKFAVVAISKTATSNATKIIETNDTSNPASVSIAAGNTTYRLTTTATINNHYYTGNKRYIAYDNVFDNVVVFNKKILAVQ